MNENKVVQFSNWIIRWRWLVILASIVSVVAMAYGMSKAYFKSDYRIFFSEDNPQLIAFEDIQATYNKSDNVLMVVTPKDGNVFTQSTLASIQWLTEQAWSTPDVLRVDSITNFQHTWAEDEDDLIVKDLICYPMALREGVYDTDCSHQTITPEQLAAYTADDFKKMGDITVNDPILKDRLIAPDRSVTAVNITVNLPENQDQRVLAVAAYARDLAKQMEARDPNLEVRLTGIVMMNVSFPEASIEDTSTLLPLMFLVVIAVLWFMVRTFSGVIASIFLIFFSILGAMGSFIWLGGFLTGPVMSAPIIILTMAVADSVHILVTFLQNYRQTGNKNQALGESLRINMQPVFLTSITTVIGFLSMNFSDVPPLRDLGNVVAIGVSLAFIYSVTFLPAMMSLLPVKQPKSEPKAYHWMDGLGDWVINNRRVLLVSSALLSIAIIAFIPKNELNDEFVKYFDESVAFRADTDYAEEHLTGLYNIFISVKSGEEQGINKPEYLQKVRDFSAFALQQSEVLHVETLTDTMKRLNRNMHGDSPEWHKLPDSRELSGQYLLLYEMSLPKGLDLTNQIDIDKSATRLGITMKSISSNEMIDIEQRFKNWFDTNAPELQVQQASPNLMFAHIGARNIKSSLTGTAIALVLISLILIFALRSLKMGLLSLIPNLVPAGLAFGLWGLFVGQVGMSLAVVAGMSLGIVVDDTVHFLSKYLRARREKGMDPQNAVRYAFNTVGMALTATTIILVAGFYIMTLSTFTMNSDMGAMTAMTIALALIIDFLMLPPILMKLEEKSNEKSTSNSELSKSATA
ncbi:RND family transporter [Pleionea sp. CnH1-48]|uniref:efflux RND transporter permease subunit n=1 Tax=Pleionea sp. CnH1-48 TaxID=2954494 RepID=UPI002096B68D|nr:MMPL family transporter [Pleionea sp. CnH1-48]MCO7226338.1 MMPL family transporter [Pleionea sp. CnH1-48]